MLSIRSLCSFSTMVCITVSNIVRQVAVLPFYNSKTTVSLQIIRQVALLPSFTSNLHCCKSGRFAPFLQQWGHSQLALLTAYFNFIPIYPNLFEFCRNFEWKERVWKCLGTWFISTIFPHATQHTSSTRFSSGPLAFLELSTNSVLLSLCWSQFTTLSSYNGLCSCR